MTNKLKAYLKGLWRRQRDTLLPGRETRDYRQWIVLRQRQRAQLYDAALEPGLLSILTAVWDGSPLGYLKDLAASVIVQVPSSEVEWVILDNGCSKPELLAYLSELERQPFIKLLRADENLGIVRGLRLCLERAVNRYVISVDADDLIYPDALRIVTTFILRHQYPALLYSDEDKVSRHAVHQPYFKPDWDPVLLTNSAYIAHLGIADRKLALALGSYTDEHAEGSPDWDLFIRFLNAGCRGIHIPEVLYSWRIHAESTADSADTKPYIASSQRAVLQRFLDAQSAGANFAVEPSSLFGPGAAQFRFTRKQDSTRPTVTYRSADLKSLRASALQMAQCGGCVCLLSEELALQTPEWINEALGVMELFPDAVMVGGRISSPAGTILQASESFGFNGMIGSPDAGRNLSDPGYFGQSWKQRSVSAVSARLAVILGSYLQNVLDSLPPEATFPFLGLWIGAAAATASRRIVYSPFLHASVAATTKAERMNVVKVENMNKAESDSFMSRYGELIPDRRYYPEPFSLTTGYRIAAGI